MATIITPLSFKDMAAPVTSFGGGVGFGAQSPIPGVDISSPVAGSTVRSPTPYVGFPQGGSTIGIWTVATLVVSGSAPAATVIIDWYSPTAGTVVWGAQFYASRPGTDAPIGAMSAQSTAVTACVADQLTRSTIAGIAGMVITVPQVLNLRVYRLGSLNTVSDTLNDTAKVRSILFTYSDT